MRSPGAPSVSAPMQHPACLQEGLRPGLGACSQALVNSLELSPCGEVSTAMKSLVWGVGQPLVQTPAGPPLVSLLICKEGMLTSDHVWHVVRA